MLEINSIFNEEITYEPLQRKKTLVSVLFLLIYMYYTNITQQLKNYYKMSANFPELWFFIF